ncbi:MAG TPA: ketoacyl-ACP synthase III [Firmicutes bacterium]|nr:ketoacyl-ACP synthase III [Bacillota bacterium]
MTQRRSIIAGAGIGVPSKRLTNRDLELLVDTTEQWIVERTGINERRIASADQATTDLAEEAAREALRDAGISPTELDLIVLCTVGPDHMVPPSSCLLQHRLGARNAAAFDINAACSGFLYGLAVADQFISTGKFKRVLLVGAETLSRVTDYGDRSTCVLFGDGAGAAVLVPASGDGGILSFCLGSDGSGAELLYIPAGGSRLPASEETVKGRMHFIRMKGNEVFKLAVRAMVRSVDEALEQAGLTRQDIDLVIPHQANRRIIEACAERLGVPDEKVVINIDRYGNTAAASIPIALAEARKASLLTDGQIVVFVGFGAGLTWGSAVLRWEEWNGNGAWT